MSDLPVAPQTRHLLVHAEARHLRNKAESLMRQTLLDKEPAALAADLRHVIYWLTYYHDKAVELTVELTYKDNV